MATYKMLETKRGVLKGDVHSKLFHKDKTYEIDDDLAGQWEPLKLIEPSREEPVEAFAEDDRDDLHEQWLDPDPAVLRHGELTAAEVIARDESPYSDGMQAADQVVGRAEGEVQPESDADGADGKPGKAKKSAGKAK